MKLLKHILFLLILTLVAACNEDEDSESVSSTGTPITCEMILKELEAESFDAIDLGDFTASCDSAVITIASDDTDTRDFDCNGTSVTASSPNGSVIVNLSDVTVSEDDFSGDFILKSSIGATLTSSGGTAAEVDCSFEFEGDISDKEDIELSSFSGCEIDGTSITFLDIPDNPDECSTSGGAATDPGFRMFYAFFEDLASKVMPDFEE
tara:strand:+ start:8501 stop:9124 length:624 start_codon:yes stop_codon:yes gene_type:complete